MRNEPFQDQLLRQSWRGATSSPRTSLVVEELCRTWVVNPQELVRVGLEQFVRRHEGLRYHGGSDSLESAVREMQGQPAGVMIVDQSSWNSVSERALLAGFERKRGHRIVMVLESPLPHMVIDVLAEQFAAVILRSSSYEQFQVAIDAVLQGQCYVDPSLTAVLLAHLRKEPKREEIVRSVLSAQEYRILPLLAEGKTNKEIGQALGLSDKTVKNYLANIFSKLQVSRRTQVAAKYAEGSVCHK